MIKSVDLSGFRLLDGFSADFGDITVVIGANASGKSSLMDFLRLVRDCADGTLDDAFSRQGGGFLWSFSASRPTEQIDWSISFTKPARIAAWQQVPLDGKQVFTYDVSLGRDAFGRPIVRHEALRRNEPAKKKIASKILEASPSSSQVLDEKRGALVPFDQAVTPPSAGVASGAGNGGVVDLARSTGQQAALRLSQMRFLNEFPTPSWIRILIGWTAFYPGFDVGRYSALRTKPAEIKPVTLLWDSGENLGMVLHEVFTRHDFAQTADMIRNFLKSAYPSVESIGAETAIGPEVRTLVRVREIGMTRPMELWDLSDGMLRFLCIAAALLNPAPPAFIAIDEPETGLHPRLLPIVADMIKAAGERTQVLVTTHSPDLLNHFSLGDIAVMRRVETRSVWFRPATRESLRVALESVMGENIGDLHRTGELEAMA